MMTDEAQGPGHSTAEDGQSDALFSGTVRPLLSIYMIAILAIAALVLFFAVRATKKFPQSDAVEWNWPEGLDAIDSVGAAFLADSWAMLGVFATTLVALAIAGTGTARQIQGLSPVETMQSGLRRGVFGGFVTIEVITKIGMACGTFLSVGLVAALYSTARSIISNDATPDVSSESMRIAVVFGATILAAHVGKFVKLVTSRVAELESSRDRLGRKVADLAIVFGGRIRGQRRPSLLETGAAAAKAVVIIAAPGIICLAIGILFIEAPGLSKVGIVMISIVTFVACAFFVVFGRIQMDTLGGRVGFLYQAFTVCFVALTHFAFVLLYIGGVFDIDGAAGGCVP